MRDNKGASLIGLVIILAILAGIAFAIYKFAIRDDGIVGKQLKVEEDYSKQEIKEAISSIINEQIAKSTNAESAVEISKVVNEGIVLLGTDNEDGTHTDGLLEKYVEPMSETQIQSANGEVTIYDKYFVKAQKLSDQIDQYGKGSKDSGKDIFVLEAVKNEEGNSSGKFELKYYDNDGKEELIETYDFYLTNQT